MLTPALDPIHDVASHFLAQDCSATIREFGTGNINKTFLVTPEGQHPFLLQRLKLSLVFYLGAAVCLVLEAVTLYELTR